MDQKKLGYIHFAEAGWDNAPEVPEEFRIKIRELFSGTVIVAGNYDKVKAQMILEKGYADLVAFGRMFVSNPDLPERLKHDIPLQEIMTGIRVLAEMRKDIPITEKLIGSNVNTNCCS